MKKQTVINCQRTNIRLNKRGDGEVETNSIAFTSYTPHLRGLIDQSIELTVITGQLYT